MACRQSSLTIASAKRARRLSERSSRERGIPFMFYTGYGDVRMRYPEAVVVEKPATAAALLSAVAGLVERRAALVS